MTLGIAVSWKLGSDPERPNKRSKTILLVVPREVVDDYLNKPEQQRKRDDDRLDTYIQRRLEIFDPDHTHTRDVPPPEEMWLVDSNVLNS